MTRKQYIRRMRELAIAVNAQLPPEVSGYRLGQAMKNVKHNIERDKYLRRCYDKMWNSELMISTRELFGIK